MRWAMRCSIASLNTVMGMAHLNDDHRAPTPELHPKPCDFAKFVREVVSHRRCQLGYITDTRLMSVEIPDSKCAKMLHELHSTWGPHQKSFTLVEVAQLLGTLVSLSRVCAWGIFLMVNLNCMMYYILASNTHRLSSSLRLCSRLVLSHNGGDSRGVLEPTWIRVTFGSTGSAKTQLGFSFVPPTRSFIY